MSLSAAVALLLVACDQTFEPLGQNDSPFSMFSILNASADTQWVRVMPIRKSVFSEAAPIDATVTLEHGESGTVVVHEEGREGEGNHWVSACAGTTRAALGLPGG